MLSAQFTLSNRALVLALSALASPWPSAVVDSFSLVLPPDDGDGLGDALAEGLGVALADGLGDAFAFGSALAAAVPLVRLFALAARPCAPEPAPAGVTLADVVAV